MTGYKYPVTYIISCKTFSQCETLYRNVFQELPLNKITDTGKSWMESFKDSNGNRFMMGWNHLDVVEKRAMTRGMNKIVIVKKRTRLEDLKRRFQISKNAQHKAASAVPRAAPVTPSPAPGINKDIP